MTHTGRKSFDPGDDLLWCPLEAIFFIFSQGEQAFWAHVMLVLYPGKARLFYCTSGMLDFCTPGMLDFCSPGMLDFFTPGMLVICAPKTLSRALR